MRHYDFLSQDQRAKLFLVEPEQFSRTSDPKLLSAALGATLYTPATKKNLVQSTEKMGKKGATSVVICLEDSIPDSALPEAEENLHATLLELKARGTVDDLPLIFVRIRTADHLWRIAQQNEGLLDVLTGFVFPKFENSAGHAEKYVSNLRHINKGYERPLYFMPVLESTNIVHRESRNEILDDIKVIIMENIDLVLAVRIGATDMSSVYGIRRTSDFTVWDVHPIASAISDIVNLFGRAADGLVVTGAVWEHFTAKDRIFKPRLRESIFGTAKAMRFKLLSRGDDTFIREVQLDRVNGITGKTVIHPSHINIVHSLAVVTHEEYSDALDITKGEGATGGAQSSFYRNKMNEIKPHYAWAQKTLLRARAFGVANENIDFIDFLEAGSKND
jgi:citrate lyase beta subunit